MCGIVGYIGNENAAPLLLRGLSGLEYRGYDSSGIATFNNGKIEIAKTAGKIENLYKKTENGKKIAGKSGVGHTRWATHGRPSEKNAHPHASKRFALVHNGIIENEARLREKYLKNAQFKSDTDTEVIVQLLQKFADEGEGTSQAICHLVSILEGSYALAILDCENPDVIYAVKNKSPLLIGKGDGFNMLGSDAVAMISETDMFYEIKDREFAVITRENVKIYTEDLNEIHREHFRLELDAKEVQKGGYPHFMLKEIEEQPFVIRGILQKYSDCDGNIAVNQNIIEAVNKSDKIYIIGCGTSYHAGLVGQTLMEKLAKKPAGTFLASEFVYNMPILSENPFFIFISQSGETADCRNVLVKIRGMGYKTLVITNVKESTLARETDYTMLLYAGPEIAVASTKAYTAQIAVLAILANALSENPIDLHREITVVSSAMEEVCRQREKIREVAENYLADARSCFYIGRSMDYYVCLEGALKLKEISYIQTEGFAAGELKHGTIALIEKGTPVIAVITQKNVSQNTRSNIKEVMARGAKVITVASENVSESGDSFVIGNVHELLTPLVSVMPAQYLAYYTALERDCDIDKPRNLAKSVTVE